MKEEASKGDEEPVQDTSLSSTEDFMATLKWVIEAMHRGELRLQVDGSGNIQVKPSIPGSWDAISPPKDMDSLGSARAIVVTELKACLNSVVAEDIEAALEKEVPSDLLEKEGARKELLSRCEKVGESFDLEGLRECQQTRRLGDGKFLQSIEWYVSQGLGSSSSGAGGPIFGVLTIELVGKQKGEGVFIDVKNNTVSFGGPASKDFVQVLLHRQDIDNLIQDLDNLRKELKSHE